MGADRAADAGLRAIANANRASPHAHDARVNEDFTDLLAALLAADARFLVVGAYALAVHGTPRATGGLDIWIDRTASNAARVWSALVAFGVPVGAIGVSEADLTKPDTVIQVGLPPRRIDLPTDISGVMFDTAWPERVVHAIALLPVPFVGRAALIANKRAAGRLKDLADLDALRAPDKPE